MERGKRMELDAANMYEDAIGPEHGLRRSEVEQYGEAIKGYTRQIRERRGRDIGFMDLPYDDRLADDIRRKASELREWCEDFVVLGIGGSALGNMAVHTALNDPHHNLLPAAHPRRGGAPRVFVLDNVDPSRLVSFVELIGEDLPRTAFNVITKSGSTAETMSQFLCFRDLLRRTPGCDPARQIVLTTDPDPEKSLLRRIARKDGHSTFPIPANVGGRFSVLSAVGLLSTAVSGVDIAALLDGAAQMDKICSEADLGGNPAALYAVLLYLSYERGRPISVLMPYSHSLRGLADWYCQLWAESLGKRDGLERKDVFVGPTPVGSVGVTDQHSVMQLYQDGPFDKTITLIEVARPVERPLPIAEGGGVEEELGYLGRHSFGELFAAELAATRFALRDKHRPNCTLRIPEVTASALGGLFMFFEYAVTYSGCLYEINPFDQPGVELGKEYTYGLMGREGYTTDFMTR